ncbi:MFS monosaccharide transporter [Fistulina hepatica ATCC 64428]|uniref:MFS monosaccharide transporter n=1 Tax=Fistulina hepatica ATCC 64428 TaxID=1128425 RepID=A0A0D7A7T2_9AGAR|nr:MFS monosaccharide transporter [Fistulina hepatica ATCC 64428]
MPAIAQDEGLGTAEAKSKYAGIAMLCFSAFGGLLYGYDTGVISSIKVMHNFLETYGYYDTSLQSWQLTSSTSSLITSILSAGTFFGALFGAPISDKIGRKYSVHVACLVFSVGIAMQTAATSTPLFAVGRVFAGLGVGIVSTVVPMYMSECAPKWIRGAVVSGYQFAITVGLLLASVVDNATKDRQSHASYRIPIGEFDSIQVLLKVLNRVCAAIQFVWALVLSSGMLFLPESPRWLIRAGKEDAAAASLVRLTGLSIDDPDLQLELADVKANLQHEISVGATATYWDCFKSTPTKIRLRTLTGIFLQALQQLTGINFIFYYGTTFFTNSGIKNAFIVTIATNVVNVGATIPGIWGVERFGRRPLLLWGAVVMCICEFIVAIVGVTISIDNLAGQRVLIAFVCIYIAAFASTWGPLAWVYVAEIYPLNVRAKGLSMAAASNWLWNFGIGYATPYLVNKAPGSAGLQSSVFFIWGGCCFLCIAFTIFFIPETKGLSLEQIDMLYENTLPWRAGAFHKKLLDENVHAADVEGGEKEGHEETENLKV